MIDYVLLVKSLILPLVIYPEDVKVNQTEENDEINIEVLVNDADFGRVIGKGGKIANAIRTVVYAAASKMGQRVKVNIGQADE
jgi:hypothetical protein